MKTNKQWDEWGAKWIKRLLWTWAICICLIPIEVFFRILYI